MSWMLHRLSLVKADVDFSDNEYKKEPRYHGEDRPNPIRKLFTAIVVFRINLVITFICEFCRSWWSLDSKLNVELIGELLSRSVNCDF